MSEGLSKEERRKQKRKEAKKKKKRAENDKISQAAETEKDNENQNVGFEKETSTEDKGKEEVKNDDEDNFESELCWCIEQLELGIKNRKPSKDEAEKAMKLIKLFKSEKTSKIKKRQMMRNTFGDYRKKIAAEARQESSKIKAAPKISKPSNSQVKRSIFVRKKEHEEDSSLKNVAIEEGAKESQMKWRFHQSENSFLFSFPSPDESAKKVSSS